MGHRRVRRARRRLAGAVAVAVVGATALGACGPSGSDEEDGASTTPSSVADAELAGEFRLGEPFGHLAHLALRSEALFSAVEAKTKECMEERGFRYETLSIPDPGGKEIAQSAMEARLQDPDQVVGYGFSEWNARQPPMSSAGGDTSESVDGQVERSGSPMPDDPNAWVYELSEEERLAWRDALGGLRTPDEEKESVTIGEGTTRWDPESCRSKGKEAIYGPLADWNVAYYTITEEMLIAADQMLTGNEALSVAIEEWKACMAEGGFEVADLKDPLRQLRYRFPPGTDAAASIEAEAEVAPVDARCFQDVDLPTILGDAQREVEAELLAENEGVVAAYLELYEAALVRARGDG